MGEIDRTRDVFCVNADGKRLAVDNVPPVCNQAASHSPFFYDLTQPSGQLFRAAVLDECPVAFWTIEHVYQMIFVVRPFGNFGFALANRTSHFDVQLAILLVKPNHTVLDIDHRFPRGLHERAKNILFQTSARLPYGEQSLPMRSWLNTFRKPEVSPIAGLAQHIVKASLSNAETLKASIHAVDEKDHTQRWFAIVCEFLYFFMHITNRFAYGELGHERRCKVQDQLYPLIVRPTIESILGHWPQNLRDKVEGEFIEKLGAAEIEYGECKKFLDHENPFAEDALFSKFAGNVCELLGVDKSDLTSFAQTYMKVTSLGMDSFKELNLSETLRAVGKEL